MVGQTGDAMMLGQSWGAGVWPGTSWEPSDTGDTVPVHCDMLWVTFTPPVRPKSPFQEDCPCSQVSKLQHIERRTFLFLFHTGSLLAGSFTHPHTPLAIFDSSGTEKSYIDCLLNRNPTEYNKSSCLLKKKNPCNKILYHKVYTFLLGCSLHSMYF